MMQLMPGEKQLYSCKSNAIIIPSEHGLSQLAVDELLPLAGLAGKEGIGGHLHITTLRMIFSAHAFNRLRGSISTPLPIIQELRPWRSGLAVGVEVETATAVQHYVAWSRSRLIEAINNARQAIGPKERIQLESARNALTGWEVNRTTETLNEAARVFFDITDAKPTVLQLIGLLNFREPEPPGHSASR